MTTRKIAIIGGGPIGLEAALRARREGYDVLLFEAGRVGEHFARYGSVRLFTPFRMNSTPLGRELLRQAGARLPEDEETLAANDLRERYLMPLVMLREMSGVVREGLRVAGVTREGMAKGRMSGRSERPFLLRPENSRGESVAPEHADVVIDASGVYGMANATGSGGLPTPGEDALGARLERHVPEILGSARARYAGKRVLLVGDGRSAANAIADLDDLIRAGGVGARTQVEWVHRDRGAESFSSISQAERDELPALREIDERATRVAREAAWIHHHAGAGIVSYRALPSGMIEATLREAGGEERRVEADRVLALVGYRPDLNVFRELQVHLCYASEGPMALAAAVLAAQARDPGDDSGCLGQVSHGPETLKNPEPNFFILGAKSYGRNPKFLLRLGHAQIEDVMTLLAGAASEAPLSPMSA
jgi:thioredoxin reductase